MACRVPSQHRLLEGLPFPHRVGWAPCPESVDLKQEGDTEFCLLLVGEVQGDHSLQSCSHLPGGHSHASQLACRTCEVVKVRSKTTLQALCLLRHGLPACTWRVVGMQGPSRP